VRKHLTTNAMGDIPHSPEYWFAKKPNPLPEETYAGTVTIQNPKEK